MAERLPSKAFISVGSQLSKKFEVSKKLNFLWFDKLIIEDFHVQGQFDPERWDRFILKFSDEALLGNSERYLMLESLLPVSTIDGGQLTSDWLDDLRVGYPRWKSNNRIMYSYPKPATAFEFAHNVLLSHIEREHGVEHFEDGYEIEQAEGSARFSIDGIRTWAKVNQRMEAQIICNAHEEVAINAMMNFDSKNDDTATQSQFVQNLSQLAVPDLDVLPWADILALKRDGSFVAIRDKILDTAGSYSSAEEAAEAFISELQRENRNIILRGQPRPLMSLGELVAGTVDLFGLFSGVKKFVGDCAELKKRRWVYAYNNIQKKLAEREEDI